MTRAPLPRLNRREHAALFVVRMRRLCITLAVVRSFWILCQAPAAPVSCGIDCDASVTSALTMMTAASLMVSPISVEGTDKRSLNRSAKHAHTMRLEARTRFAHQPQSWSSRADRPDRQIRRHPSHATGTARGRT